MKPNLLILAPRSLVRMAMRMAVRECQNFRDERYLLPLERHHHRLHPVHAIRSGDKRRPA